MLYLKYFSYHKKFIQEWYYEKLGGKIMNRPRNIFQNMNCIKSHWTLWKENHCRLIKGKNSEFKEVSSNELKIIDAQTRYIRLVSWQDFMKNFSDWKRRVQISSFFSFDYFEQWKCIENQKNVDTVTSKTMFLPVYTQNYSTYSPLDGWAVVQYMASLFSCWICYLAHNGTIFWPRRPYFYS